jgi:peptidoglycan/xylan/chitin deacetylase (PgdA/CDA1 family)
MVLLNACLSGGIAVNIASMKFSSGWAVICLTLLVSFSIQPNAADQPNVNVILWFDTEDYLLPADDDATKRLAEMLAQRGIRATFKIVGEKARVLERRGRRDVIAALKKHDIGYHANFHSVHPTPSEYLADCGLLDGIAEFERREGPGAADVRRILGVKTLVCYGQPGSSWAPQTIAALKDIGVAPHSVPCYVDEGTHVGLNEQPFWYANALVVYHMGQNYTRMDLHDPGAVEPAKKKVSDIAGRLRGQGGGLISIFYHPCEWVHQEFWDGVNFRRGANPPREQWKPPPQRPPEETEAAFKRFAEYIDHIHSIPGVRFVTAGDLPGLYPDAVRAKGATEADLNEIASRLAGSGTSGADFQVIGGRAYSVADQFELLAMSVGETIDGRQARIPFRLKGLLGPDAPPPSSPHAARLDWFAFRDSARDVLDFIKTNQRVPARVFIGAEAVPPADFLVALASASEFHRKHGKLPLEEGVTLGRNLELLPAQHVAKDTPDLFGGWIIHKEGFRAPKIMEVARLQAWTLKPALSRVSAESGQR